MIQFKKDQLAAINYLDNNVILSASAGAGKTAVLIARLMKRILVDKVHIQEICALTFTDAAAQEMKMRLLKEMHQEFQNEKNQEKSIFLEEQISLIETAEITTLHSYCLSLIKNHGYIIGINPSRSENILTDAQKTLLKKEAFDAVLNQWLEEKYTSVYDLTEYFSGNPIDTFTFESSIYESALWMQTHKDPSSAMEDVKKIYAIQNFEAWPSFLKDLFFLKYEDFLSQTKIQLQNYIDLVEIEARSTTKPYKNLEVVRIKMQLIHQLHQKTVAKDITFYKELLDALDFQLPTVTKSESIPEVREPLVKALEKIVSEYHPLEDHFTMMNGLQTIVKDYLDFTVDFIDKYKNFKKIDNVLDFDDFEHYALEILKKNNYAISKELGDHYQEIMVDEFQDTNEVQDEIIRLISNGKNIFRVGDIKQSIYGFRGAEPEIMSALMRNSDHKTLYLENNFRSTEKIVDFNNTVFKGLMNHTNNSQYSDMDHVGYGSSQQKGGEDVELHLLTKAGKNDYDYSSNEFKARHIAQEIIKHHEQGHPFKNMTVLVRGHAQKIPLKKAFEAVNIPHYVSERIGFFNSDIVATVLDFLYYHSTENPYYLAKILVSPFYNLSEDDLAKIKLLNKDFKKGLFLYNSTLAREIQDLMTSWNKKDIVSILQEIYALNNTYNEYLSLQDKTNLDFLLDKASLFQETSTGNIQAFLLFFAALDEDQTAEASPLSVDDDLVEVMTIHQSKGLQFPIVFYWGAGPLTIKDHSSSVIFDDLSLGFMTMLHPYRLSSKTLIRQIIEYKQTHKELEETLRLLYVALTRAETKLIVVDIAKDFERKSLNKNLLRYYKRQVDLLIASSSRGNSTIMELDVLDITNNQLEDREYHGRIPTFIPLDLKIESKNFEGSMNNFDLNPQSKWAMQFGTALHDAIEILPHERWNPKLLENFEQPIQKRLHNYNQHPFTQELYQYSQIEHELPFLIKEGDEVISGIIDFVAFNNDKLIIVDFKSDNVEKELLFERYTNQLLRYKNALEAVYPEHVIFVYIYSFHLNDYLALSL